MLALITLVLALLEEKKEWFEKISLGPAWAYGAVCALLLLSVELIGLHRGRRPVRVLSVLGKKRVIRIQNERGTVATFILERSRILNSY